MDLTPLFKACIKTVKLQNKSLPSLDKNRILKKTQRDDFSKKTKDIKYQISQLRNFLIENRAAYMQFACHLKRSAQVSLYFTRFYSDSDIYLCNIESYFRCRMRNEI